MNGNLRAYLAAELAASKPEVGDDVKLRRLRESWATCGSPT